MISLGVFDDGKDYKVVASIFVIENLRGHFSYQCCLACGIPFVTLLGMGGRLGGYCL